MPLLIVQLAVLVAVAFIIGCLLGRFLRRRNAAVPDSERTIIAAARATLPVDEKPETPKEAAAPAEAEEPKASTQPSEPETMLGAPCRFAFRRTWFEASIIWPHNCWPHGAIRTVAVPLGVRQRPSIGDLAAAGVATSIIEAARQGKIGFVMKCELNQ